MSKIKLVPIDARAAGDCAREGRATGAGYYKTVNLRVSDYPRAIAAADTLQRMIDEIDGGDATLDELRRMAVNTLQASTPPATAGAWCVGMLRDMGATFPGLLNGDDDVNGGDLVDFMSEHADELRQLCKGAPDA